MSVHHNLRPGAFQVVNRLFGSMCALAHYSFQLSLNSSANKLARARYGVARYGVARYGVARYGVARYGVARCPVPCRGCVRRSMRRVEKID